MRWLFFALALGCGTSGGAGLDGGTEDGPASDGSMMVPPPKCDPPGTLAMGVHVTPTGSASGDGSMSKPWDLATALQLQKVPPGTIIWLHGGTYKGGFVAKLEGTQQSPVTLRGWPGERAILDGAGSPDPTLQIYHDWGVLRDFEVTNSTPDRAAARPSGIYVEGKHVKLQNLLVHDVGTGIIANSAGPNDSNELAEELEVTGCILWNSGWEDTARGHGHHFYLQNKIGTKHLFDNVAFNAFGFGFHLYSDTDAHYAQGYELEGNVSFMNGAAQAGASKLFDDYMIGHNGTFPVARATLRQNMGYTLPNDDRDIRLGWSAPNDDVTLDSNYVVGSTIFQPSWKTITMTNNVFYGPIMGASPASFPQNMFLTQRPTGAKVFVRPSRVTPGRAHIIVYDWDRTDTVDVDASGILQPGAAFELRNVLDLSAPPVLSGSFTGKLTIPMGTLKPAQPIGAPQNIVDAEDPGKDFGVFLLTGVSCPP
jgi:hypothetical protein